VKCLFSVISTAVVFVIFLHESYVSQKTILEVIVSNPWGGRNFYICYRNRKGDYFKLFRYRLQLLSGTWSMPKVCFIRVTFQD